jgi:hypothetical protein
LCDGSGLKIFVQSPQKRTPGSTALLNQASGQAMLFLTTHQAWPILFNNLEIILIFKSEIKSAWLLSDIRPGNALEISVGPDSKSSVTPVNPCLSRQPVPEETCRPGLALEFFPSTSLADHVFVDALSGDPDARERCQSSEKMMPL